MLWEMRASTSNATREQTLNVRWPKVGAAASPPALMRTRNARLQNVRAGAVRLQCDALVVVWVLLQPLQSLL
jgi:hypothetical protein